MFDCKWELPEGLCLRWAPQSVTFSSSGSTDPIHYRDDVPESPSSVRPRVGERSGHQECTLYAYPRTKVRHMSEYIDVLLLDYTLHRKTYF